MKQQQREPNSKERCQPNAAETAAVKNHIRKRGRPTAPRIKVNGTASFSIDHPDPILGQVLLMEAIGTVDHDFFRGLLRQLINGCVRAGQIDECSVNFMVAVIKGIKPRDDLEIMLAAQMAAIHDAFMRGTQALANARTIPEQDSADRLLNKLARTFATQMEALQRYRNGLHNLELNAVEGASDVSVFNRFDVGGLGYAAMYALANYVDPKTREMSVTVPPDHFVKRQ